MTGSFDEDYENATADVEQVPARPASSRRTFVAGALGAGAGVAATLGTQYAAGASERNSPTPAAPPLQEARVPFYGQRQAGVDTPAPSYALFIALDLNSGTDAGGVQRLLRVLTSDAASLTQGTAPVVDQEPELATVPAHLTVTFGFGERIFDIVNPAKKPAWLQPLTAFEKIDQLQDQWNDGDLLLQLCSSDRFTLAHAQRMLLKTARSMSRVRWVQEGFRRAYGSEPNGQTMRNLFGQVDGTINPSTLDDSMDRFVWGNHEELEPWEPGGTSLVIRRIHMNLDTWDQSDRPAREDAVGRNLTNGAPLTGTQEHDPADLSATNELGFTVIAPYAHIRRASAQSRVERILRRGYNYDLPVQNASGFSEHFETDGGVSNSGLIFCSYQADPLLQFLPIQERLAELDMLNTWTVPIGSAVFALPAGCEQGGFIGENLFT
ncbi:Dyp-type peroxidase [Rothia sp. P100]|uniref:Dyp-type peroxidase n=1 Tax=Rothia sp. P100 TaxID=2939578 RepID=UPI0020419368|nr:Dyp-type peroxidase [Rothia sp. P100]MCM3510964.1 Dyp-type peroxidase [Rothia sp. P100]